MNKVNYIIFHPENNRQKVKVFATVVISNNEIKHYWEGDIYVDAIERGNNEDPFVFQNPWLYSYCHASQLKQKYRSDDNYLQVGSKILFVSGQNADKNELVIDTLFQIGSIQKWENRKPDLKLPLKYQDIEKHNLDLWNRHFRFPFLGVHDSVIHTYESEVWDIEKESYSFLPVNSDGERVKIAFDEFSLSLSNKIKNKVKGKYPVELTNQEFDEIYSIVENKSAIKVVKDISTSKPIRLKNLNSNNRC